MSEQVYKYDHGITIHEGNCNSCGQPKITFVTAVQSYGRCGECGKPLITPAPAVAAPAEGKPKDITMADICELTRLRHIDAPETNSKTNRLWSECPRCFDGLYNDRECSICWGTGRITDSLLRRRSTPPTADPQWRVGKQVPLNVYEGDRPVCQCHTEEDARRIVEAVNGRS